MKKLNLLSLLMMMLAFAACSSDDEQTNLAAGATGNYDGYAVASCNYFSNMVAADQVVKLTSSEVNKVNISYESDTWGTITIDNADLSGNESNITIKGEGKSLMGHAGNAANEYECSVEGTLIGKELALTFSCPQIMGGLKIEFKQGDVPAEIVVPGTYTGYTDAKCAYFSDMMSDDQTITISQNSDNTYKISYTSDTWGEFTIENATAQYSNGKFTIAGDGTTQMGHNGSVSDYACTLEGTIDVAKEDPTFTFSVPTVMGGLTIIFKSGEMPATE